jgi:hypothetical protein
MKTSFSIIVGLVTAVVAVTVASAQDSRYSTKPWLYPQRLGTPAKTSAAPAAAEIKSSVAYSTKPWLKHEREFQIALFPEGKSAAAGKAEVRPERAINPKDYSSKPWLR